MNSDITEHVQDSIRPGAMTDLYYYGETNIEKQAYPVVVNNKFYTEFPNLSAGTSQFVISPNQGVSDIIVGLELPTRNDISGANSYYGLATTRGWGYQALRSVSVRYGSSAQYFFTGQQILEQNMIDCENDTKRDALLLIGGQSAASDDIRTDVTNRRAYLYLNLPHNSPRAEGKPLPFPSDLLVQPIVITIEMNNISDLFYSYAPTARAGGYGTAPTSFSKAYIQVRQDMMSDSADLLSRRVDMNTHAYTFPLKYFPQQEVQVRLGAGTTHQVNLSGFRAGEVKKVLLWLTKNGETNNQTNNPKNPLRWYQLSQVQLTYNGEIFYRSEDQAGSIWNLVIDKKQGGFNTGVMSVAGSAGSQTVSYAPYFSPYLEIPFAQPHIEDANCDVLVHGKPILNAIVNLSLSTPSSEEGGWTLHALYLYNASLMCSRGSAEYIF